jgi:asparagine synthase (glutamine-hydrolysing)
MRHRAIDGLDTASLPGFLLAHLHFWTTPEEIGERQPLQDPQSGTLLALDGRIDNRADLQSALDVTGVTLSDASLLLRAYARWGASCFRRLLGPFAVVLRDGITGEVVAARDPMGDRTLFYATTTDGLAIASEEHALLALPGVSAELDATTLSRHFAIEAPARGATFFRAIRELPPGTILRHRDGRLRLEAYWTPEPPEPIRYRRDEDYAEHLSSVLGDAVAARLRSAGPVGVSLSGGMDSTSVAAFAVERLPGGLPWGRLASFSWYFDDLTECDERRWITPVVDALGLEAFWVLADPHWPGRDLETWPLNPSSPLANPYRRLKQALYEAAASRGVRTLLTGVFSDALYAGHEAWLASCLAAGFWREPARHAGRVLAAGGIRGAWRDPALRAAARPLLPRRRRPLLGASRPGWLTEKAWRLVRESEAGVPGPLLSSLAARRAASVYSDVSGLWPGEAVFASRCRVDVRDPFRDLRVVRFMLAIPAHQLRRGPVLKHVLRRAMKNRLPADVVGRTVATPLVPFYRLGVLDWEAGAVAGLLRSPDAAWRDFVDEEWLLGGFPERFRSLPDGRELLLPWLAALAEPWRRSL